MKNLVPTSCRFIPTALWLILCLLSDHARGVILYWDPNGNGTPAGGTWSTDSTVKQWSANSTGGTDQSWSSGNDAYFCAGPTTTVNQGTFAITLTNAVGVQNIYSGMYNPGPTVITFSGSGSISFITSGGQITAKYASGQTPAQLIFRVPLSGGGTALGAYQNGIVSLEATNTFSSTFTIGSAGTVTYNNSRAFGTGTIAWSGLASGATLSATAANLTISNSMTHAAITEIFGNNTGLTFKGPWSFPSSGAATIENYGLSANTITVSGPISGAGTLIINSTTANYNHPWTFTGTNTFYGFLNIAAGTLTIGGSGSWDSGSYSANITDNGVFVYSSSAAQTLSGNISGTGSLVQNGPGTLTLSGANGFTGPVTINGGVLKVNSIDDFFTSALGEGDMLTLGGGTLSYTGSASETTTRTFMAYGTNSAIDVTSGSLALNGVLKGPTNVIVTKTGSGTLILGGSTINSNLAMRIGGGTVVLNKSGLVGAYALAGSTIVSNGATLRLGGNIDQIAPAAGVTVASGGVFETYGQDESLTALSLAGTGISGGGALVNSVLGTLSAITATANPGFPLNADTSIGGVGDITLDGVISGARQLTYAGNGVLRLNSVNTYSAGTTISSGTLMIGSTGSIVGNVTNAGGVLRLDRNSALAGSATLVLAAAPAPGAVLLNFAGGQSVQSLYFGGTRKAAGTWAASGATHTNAAFTGTGMLYVSTGPASTISLSLTSGSNPSTYGTPLTFTASVTGNSPTGTAQLIVDGVPTGSPVALSGGSAALVISTLTARQPASNHCFV